MPYECFEADLGCGSTVSCNAALPRYNQIIILVIVNSTVMLQITRCASCVYLFDHAFFWFTASGLLRLFSSGVTGSLLSQSCKYELRPGSFLPLFSKCDVCRHSHELLGLFVLFNYLFSLYFCFPS